jgi:hypothetical protein
MRIVCGGKWTTDGRWVVVGTWNASWGTLDDVILYDPNNGNPFCDIWDCREWIKENLDTGS